MQTAHHSRLEVGVDFGLSVLVNLGAQLFIYGALATAERSLAFAACVLFLAVPRRYAMRRLFNAFISPGARQTRWQSWLEVGVDTLLAIVIAMLLQRLVYGSAATLTRAGSVTVLLYAMTMGRRYALRRVFDAWEARQPHTAIV
ncbi:MAG: hypothetical protein AB7N91_17665 [Candidatus Tectimicrobiota bacterium]